MPTPLITLMKRIGFKPKHSGYCNTYVNQDKTAVVEIDSEGIHTLYLSVEYDWDGSPIGWPQTVANFYWDLNGDLINTKRRISNDSNDTLILGLLFLNSSEMVEVLNSVFRYILRDNKINKILE